MTNWYEEDLAYIHDVGFSNYIQQLIPGVIKILKQNQITKGLIVDLGCGSGLSSQKLVEAGYRVLGIDISEDMLKIAKKRTPTAQFRQGSLFKVQVPSCSAVICLGECINYLFDSDNNQQTLIDLFHRIYNELIPEGYFIFDVLQATGNRRKTQSFWEGENWMILVEKQEDNQKKTLTRKITTFRQQGLYYRRNDEIHQIQLYKSNELAKWLTEINFKVEIINNCVEFPLPTTNSLLIAQKVF